MQAAVNRCRPKTAPDGPESGGLSPRQEAAALALASGCQLREAARKSSAGQRTIRTWTATLPAFNRRVSELRAQMTDRALGRLTDGMAIAAATLRELLTAESEMCRLSAARAILELGSRLRESIELEARVVAL